MLGRRGGNIMEVQVRIGAGLRCEKSLPTYGSTVLICDISLTTDSSAGED